MFDSGSLYGCLWKDQASDTVLELKSAQDRENEHERMSRSQQQLVREIERAKAGAMEIERRGIDMEAQVSDLQKSLTQLGSFISALVDSRISSTPLLLPPRISADGALKTERGAHARDTLYPCNRIQKRYGKLNNIICCYNMLAY